MTDFVLIHGSYQGGWIWKLVSERLRAKGHNVLAPTLDGCGERASQMRAGITTETHGEEIAKLLYFHDLKDVVLVGCSRRFSSPAIATDCSPAVRASANRFVKR